MRFPVIRAAVRRRISILYRVDSDVSANLLPPPFRPRLVRGSGIAGVCLTRFAQLRTRFVPPFLGMSAEDAVHWVAAEWDSGQGPRTGVYILRRDTSSRLVALAGGRLLPGVRHHARFKTAEDVETIDIAMDSDDDQTHVDVAGRLVPQWPGGSSFSSLNDAAEFERQCSIRYSESQRPAEYVGVECHVTECSVVPMVATRTVSSIWDDGRMFPPGTVQYDSALAMRNVVHVWQPCPTLVMPLSPQKLALDGATRASVTVS